MKRQTLAAARQLAARSAESALASGALSILERAARRPDALRVLTYHRVSPPEVRPWLYRRIAVTPEIFAAQMRFLAEHYCVLSLEEVLRRRARGESLPLRAVLITFDDAYCDFAEYAWPILQQHRLPATLFVPTAFPDGGAPYSQGFWWDRLSHAVSTTARRTPLATPAGVLALDTPADRSRAFTALRDYVKAQPHAAAMAFVAQVCDELGVESPPAAVLGWEELRGLAREGVTLGAHTRTHPLLNRIPVASVREEVGGSLEDLRREIGDVPPALAYPSGGFDAAVVEAAAAAGIAVAFTTDPGVNNWRNLDLLRIRRINVGWRTSLPVLRANLLAPA